MKRISLDRRYHRRDGKIAVVTALLLVVLLGVLACALDTGWIVLTKTQLNAATDSGALAGGTELLPGLGVSAYRTPAAVELIAKQQAVNYAAKNRAGDRAAVYVDAARDVTMGTGRLNRTTGQWEFNWGATPYNAVRVIGHRDVIGSNNGDAPLPLFFAPIIGSEFSNLDVLSTAVILPASGIRIPPGSGLSSALSPFAFEQKRWKKYFRAQAYFKDVLGSDRSLITANIMDNGPGGDGTELFFEKIYKGNSQNFDLYQRFDDFYKVVDPSKEGAENIIAGPDGILEVSIYPLGNEPGNFGTVDIGSPSNGTPDLRRQILYGPNEEDLSYFEDSKIAPTEINKLTLGGDTGISAGMKDAIEQIIGHCRGILLFDTVSDPGNNAKYVIVDIVGSRWMHLTFQGNNKILVIQPCSLSDPAAVPDFDEDIGPYTTVFTPLILAQ